MKTTISWPFIVALSAGAGLGTLAVYDTAHEYLALDSFTGEFWGALILLGPLMCALLLLVDRTYYRTRQKQRELLEHRLDQIAR
jgi:hypothetical protein